MVFLRLCGVLIYESLNLAAKFLLLGKRAKKRRNYQNCPHLLPSPLLFFSMCTCDTWLHRITGAAEAMPRPNLEYVQHFIGK